MTWNWELFIYQTPDAVIVLDSMTVVKTEWERLLSLFI